MNPNTFLLPESLRSRHALNLGCGLKPLPGAINIDQVAEVCPDLVLDLGHRPWPLPENHFEEVHAYDVLEHLDDIVGTMEEVHRICRPNAKVILTVPHYSCANAFTDPTHRHYFGAQSFNYFTGENEFAFYSSKRFRKSSTAIIFFPGLINKIVWRFAARHPVSYERRWAWLFPAWFLRFELTVCKEMSQG